MIMTDFLNKLASTPKLIDFTDTMAVIEANYIFAPVAFSNGDTHNAEGTNQGSCKLFSFAKLNQLDEQATLACFGDYYRQDVLKNPEGSDHANIRNFIKYGWSGITFEQQALTPISS